MSKRSRIEDEFYNSKIYNTVKNSGGRIMHDVVKTVEDVAHSVSDEVNRGRNTPPEVNAPPVNPPRTKTEEFVRNRQERQNAPKPEPKPPKKKKPKSKFLFLRILMSLAVGILCFEYIPLIWYYNIILSLAGVVLTYRISTWVFKDRSQKPEEQKGKQSNNKKEEPAKVKKSDTGNEELDKVINEGYEYIRKLWDLNIAIEDEGVSDSIDRMEAASKSIFEFVKKRPSKIPQIKKFMNYYLPTTLKLLIKYEELSSQEIKGEHISSTMFDIEGMMKTIATAFEKQIDSLYESDAMDVQADISVFESILEQEGLKNDEFKVKL